MFDWLHRHRNRRFGGREFVLDVKLRTRQMRAARWRMADIVAFTFAAACFLRTQPAESGRQAA